MKREPAGGQDITINKAIVENAIYHGIKHRADAGHIHISGGKVNDQIELRVVDDGIGMDSDKIKTLISRIDFDKNQLYFGEQYGLEI